MKMKIPVRPKSPNDSAAELQLERDKVATAESSDSTFAENKLTLCTLLLQQCHGLSHINQNPKVIKDGYIF